MRTRCRDDARGRGLPPDVSGARVTPQVTAVRAAGRPAGDAPPAARSSPAGASRAIAAGSSPGPSAGSSRAASARPWRRAGRARLRRMPRPWGAPTRRRAEPDGRQQAERHHREPRQPVGPHGLTSAQLRDRRSICGWRRGQRRGFLAPGPTAPCTVRGRGGTVSRPRSRSRPCHLGGVRARCSTARSCRARRRGSWRSPFRRRRRGARTRRRCRPV
jgi:hypothetical protein